MRVGLIAEGASDMEVLASILKGWLGLDRADLSFLRPELDLDETDLAQLEADRFSNWEIVRQECVDRKKIDTYLTSFDEERLVIVQIDTAECALPNYGVQRPASGDPVDLVGAVWTTMLGWLQSAALPVSDPSVLNRVRFAVCVEETDAWVLAIHEAGDTCKHHDPKKRLDRKLNSEETILKKKDRQRHFNLPVPRQYAELSKPLRKRKELNKAAENNASLRLFLMSLPAPDEE